MMGGARDLRERDAPVGAGDGEDALGESDVAGGRPPADARRSACPCRSTFIAARSSAEPPTAIEREPNVPEPYGTWSVSPSMISIARHRHAEPRRDDLREGGGVALAVIVGAEQRLHAAVRLHPDRRRLEEADARAERARPSATARRRRIHIAGHAEAAELSRPRAPRPGVARSPCSRRSPAAATNTFGKLPQS